MPLESWAVTVHYVWAVLTYSTSILADYDVCMNLPKGFAC